MKKLCKEKGHYQVDPYFPNDESKWYYLIYRGSGLHLANTVEETIEVCD